MYRKLSCLSLAVALAALALACRRDADAGAVVDELNSFTREIVKRVESNPNTSAGVDEAQQYFDSRKDEMKQKLDSLKGVGATKVSEETSRRLFESVQNNVVTITKLQTKYVEQTMRDPALKGKLDKLSKDYEALLRSVDK